MTTETGLGFQEVVQPGIQSIRVQDNFFWALTGNGLYAASQWLMLIMLARLTTPTIMGRYTLALSIAAPVMLFCNLQLRALQAGDVGDHWAFSDYLSLRLLTSSLSLAVVAGIAFGFGYSREAAWVILAVGCAKVIESVSDILFGLMQKHERLDYIAISQILKGALSLAMLAWALYATRQLLPGVAAICGAWLIVLLSVDVRNLRRFSSFSHIRQKRQLGTWRRLGSLSHLALPLGFVAMLTSLHWNVSRYFLESYRGETELGYFAAMAYLPNAGMIAIEALTQSTIARLARHYLWDRTAYRRLLLCLLVLVAAVGLVGVLIAYFAGAMVLRLLYGPAYAHQPQVFVWLMASGTAMYLCGILGVSLTSARFLRVQLPVSLTVVTTSVISSWLLVPRFGQLGAAWSLLIASVVWLVLLSASTLYVVSRRVPATARANQA